MSQILIILTEKAKFELYFYINSRDTIQKALACLLKNGLFMGPRYF
jgi:hypothetical protein